jgi:hypothetical protein
MSKRLIGIVLAAVGSVVLGVAAAHLFYHTALSTLPIPQLNSSYSLGAAYLSFFALGVLFGALIFGWALLVVALARFFRNDLAKAENRGAETRT